MKNAAGQLDMRTLHSIIYSQRTEGEPLSRAVETLLRRMGGLTALVSPGDRVLIKPNFVAPFPGATTDIEFIDTVIREIRRAGGVPFIGESSGYEFDTDITFEMLGVRRFAAGRDIELVNFDRTGYREIELENGMAVEVARPALESSLIVNLPVLKEHSVTGVSGAVKNLFGLLSRPSRRYLHCRGLDNGIAALCRSFKRVIHLVDARRPLSRAVFGEQRKLGFCLGGLDPFALDHFGSRLMGISPGQVKYLRGTGAYTVEGTVPDGYPLPHHEYSLKRMLRKMLYKTAFFLDLVKYRSVGGESIIPLLHWYFGLRPSLDRTTPDELRVLSLVCPVGAIDAESKRIVREKCMKVRCLKCYHSSAGGKIILKGFNLPGGEARR